MTLRILKKDMEDFEKGNWRVYEKTLNDLYKGIKIYAIAH